ncbi:MAG: translation initiation factor IF-1 [Bdellovibrionales bacterium]|nr:translation initiation factor IF-1 [Bdellovibrionales bacterium]
MSRDDLVRVEGVITSANTGSQFSVKLANGHEIRARLSGRLRRFHIRVIVGDRVTIGLSPYDPSHGLILARERLAHRRR